MDQKLYIAGRIIIPIYFPVNAKDKFNQFARLKCEINSNTIRAIHADLHTVDNKEHCILARKCKIDWFEIVNEEDIL